MGKIPVKFREVVYTLSPYEQNVMGGLWRDIPHKVSHYSTKVRDAVIFAVLPLWGIGCLGLPVPQAHTLLLARCYYLSNQPYRTYHLLKDSSDPASRYLFATACLSLNRLTEAEDAMLPGPAAHGGVAHGAAGHFLLAKVHTLMNRHDSAASHHRAALSLDPMLWGGLRGAVHPGRRDRGPGLPGGQRVGGAAWPCARWGPSGGLHLGADTWCQPQSGGRRGPHARVIAGPPPPHRLNRRPGLLLPQPRTHGRRRGAARRDPGLWRRAGVLRHAVLRHPLPDRAPGRCVTGWALCTTGRALAGAVRYAESARAFARARALEPGRLADMEAYSTVLWHLRAGPALSALAQDLLALDRLSPAAWCAAGNCFSLQRDHDTALRFFRRALQLDGGRAYAHTLAGHEFLALEDFDKAMGCYRAALRIELRHYNAWFGMGHIFYRQEKWSLAEYHFRRATAIHPTSSVLRCYLGMALRRLERLEEALLELHRAIAADPKNPLARFEAANVLLACERPRDALHELQALHDVAPQEVSTYFQMGKVHKRLGEVDQAMRCFCAALDLQPPAADSELIKGAIERLRVTEDALDEEM
ncbi:Cell division cycle protein 27-like protein [Auxenochlorella protothecoides]|uniref:Cell division cycle protein 27-like protein n=1 Tax=Auxenochlorella protothecoides TaxID=3075 RepID=A0A087SRH5_AUXPR|nr:Cell division cycle protein 27-like protein [Auxenochlorella protothecoides]KFM28329.1 Cell division cycle protein 27-like protein [Auxenochlorella protothecoides]